jgi:hypothetical protein
VALKQRRVQERLVRRAKTRTRWRWDRSEKVTAGLAATALATAGTVMFGQFTRMLRRRVHSRREAGLIATAGQATQDTVAVAVEGYAAAPRSETVLFHMLSAFVFSFGLVRLSTYGQRGGWWPLGTVSVSGRHIHHFIPGIGLAFTSGAAAMLSDSHELENLLAIPFGVGLGLTFDEAALLLDLEDVYWSREGVLSVQVSLGLAATLGGTVLAMRMLRRGERRTEAAGVIPAA